MSDRTTTNNPRLRGKKEIEQYADADWRTIRRWIDHFNFPATLKLDGVWRSDKSMVDKWFRSHLVFVDTRTAEDENPVKST